jgi:amino acid adenylation domain-containing protein
MIAFGTAMMGRAHDESYVQCLTSRTALAPGAVAARRQESKLSFGELNARANRLAHYLESLGIGPEILVGICLERSLQNLVAMLAVWKARGAFLQLPPDYPQQRLNYMMSDAGAKVLITQERFLTRFSHPEASVLCLDNPETRERLEQSSAEEPMLASAGEDLAYVIYTSGSTGRPKGVEILQRSVINHSVSIASAYGLSPQDRVLQFASPGFDVSLEEIFPTWLMGGQVIVRPEDCLASLPRFLRFVSDESISVLNLPTAFWHDLVEQLTEYPLPLSVRLVVIGGERASSKAFGKWKQVVPRAVQLINSYGPTECTITSTCFVADLGQETLPIGRPIANTCAVVLDPEGQPVEPGKVGELYLAGKGVARGYRGRPELTAQSFVANPLPSEVSAERLYKTGDLVRCREDQNLEFVGRVDEQLKIRGFRIEPGEIEAAMLECPGIKGAVVTAREHSTERNRLVAYYVTRAVGAGVDKIRAFLATRLPVYMIPSVFVRLEALPLAHSGKVDRHALPDPSEVHGEEQRAMEAPQSETEMKLADIWRQVLRIKSVGVQDDFFALGGDSLLAMQIFTRVRDRFGIEPSWVQFFETPTIAGLALALRRDSQTQTHSKNLRPAAIARNRPLPASFVQETLWFLQQLSPESDAYNLGLGFRFKGELDSFALTGALNELCRRHEIFRTGLQYQDGALVQTIAPSVNLGCESFDLSLLSSTRRESELRRHLNAEIQLAFDLAKPPLLRAKIFRLNESESVLSLVMHHAISDGWSLSLMAEELALVYETLATQRALPQFVPPSLQYADFAYWQRQVFRGEVVERELEYWGDKLKGAPPTISFPDAGSRARVRGKTANRSSLDVPARLAAAAQGLAQAHRATPFIVLLTALALALQRVTGQSDLVIGTVVAGRTDQEFENVPGCFMNFVPLRIRLAEAAAPQQALNVVRRVIVDSQAHQECPFEKLVAGLCPKRDGDSNPLFNVALLWHNYPKRKVSWGAQLSGHSFLLPQHTALLDLRFEAEPAGDKWSLNCEYNESLFRERQITGLLAEISRSLKDLVRPSAGCLQAREPVPAIKAWFHRLRRGSRDAAA